MPVGAWIGSRSPLTNWIPNPEAGILWRVVWASPIFDLRPDLGALSENRNVPRVSAVPIWRAAGQNSGAQLFVQCSTPNDSRGLQVVSTEEAHVCDVTQVVGITGAQDVTAEFTSKGLASVVTFSPYGDGYPIRYWRLFLRFEIVTNQNFPEPGTPPSMTVQAALY